MDLLPLSLIGGVCAVGSAIALAAGVGLVVAGLRAGGAMREELSRRVLKDAILFGLWLLGLVGGLGLLAERAWARPVLELFCAGLAALVLLVSAWRLAVAPPPRGSLFLQSALFVLPIVAFCAAAIATLRGEATRVLG